MSEPAPPKSSWQSWSRSAQQATSSDDADLNVVLEWGDESTRAGEVRSSSSQLARDDWVVADDGYHGEGLAGSEEEFGEGGFGELMPTVPLLPSIAGRVEAITGVLRSISQRVDAMSAATDVYRATTVDRIDEFTETVLEQGRRTDQVVDEYRRTTERAIAELRRRVAEQADLVGKLIGRVEEIATDVTSMLEAVVPAVREPVVPALASDLAGFADVVAGRIVERVQAVDADLGHRIDAMAAQIAATQEVVNALADAAEREPLESRPSQSPTDRAVGELRELLEVVIDTIPGSSDGSGSDLRATIAQLQASVDELARRPLPEPGPVTLDDRSLGRLADAVLDRLDLDALGMLVAEHLTQNFEVVADDQPRAPAPPVADEPSPATGRRSRRS